jgi:hypothetical protein
MKYYFLFRTSDQPRLRTGEMLILKCVWVIFKFGAKTIPSDITFD